MLKDNTFANKVIIVTGGGTGLGKSMVETLLSLGAKVVICSRKLEKLEQTALELSEKTGGEILPIACDVREITQVEQVISKTIEHFGRIDGLINNAAGNFISPTERLSSNAFSTVVDIVLKGGFNFTLTVGKYWIANKIKGSIVNIVTTYASTGSGFVVPSACAKAGMEALTKSLAVEWGKYGIRTNAIAPGPFPTKGAWDRLFPEPIAKQLDPTLRNPLKRLGQHHELANLVSYLLSDFSGFVNGEVVTIDGGEWLQGAGEFNHLDAIPNAMWDVIEQATRSAK